MGKRVLAAFGVVAAMDGVLAAGLSAAPTSADAATSSTAERTGSSEEAQLRALYRQAVAEGGRLVAFTGGDRSGQDDYLKNEFEKKFPKAKVDIAGDFSKNHDARVDHQAAEHHVVADVVHPQTLDDFPRWKKEGWWEPATTWRTSAAAAATVVSRRSPCPASPPGRPGRGPAPLLKNAPHQAAVMLYLSRLLSKDAQEHAIGTWSARTDVAPSAGRKGIFGYATMNPLGLGEFMSDRAALDRYKARLSLCTGDVHGANSSDPTSSASTRSTSRAPKVESLLDAGCPPRRGSRRTPRREAISPTITLHPRKHA